jgi:predicted GNAT family acetyltransferase
MDFEIQHQEGNKYYAVIDGNEAAVGYFKVDDETLDFQHTYVPEELRGQGVAEKLVRHALDDARKQGYRVLPSCPYVKRFVERHPEYQQGLARA